MANHPEVEEARIGLSESVYHAQIIVEAFSKALQKKQCTSRVPIAVYTEAELFESRLQSMLAAVGEDLTGDPELEPEVTFEYVAPVATSSSQAVLARTQESRRLDNDIINVKRDWIDDCFNCGIQPIDMDWGSMFDSILERIKGFLTNIEGMFKIDFPNYCQFSYLLSYICIPVLVAILAMILAAIIKLLATLKIGDFGLSAFIMGIVMEIISMIMRFVLALISSALSPVSCLLDSLTDIANKIPTRTSLKKRLPDAEYELLYGEPKSADNTPDALANTTANFNAEVSDINKVIKASIGGIAKSVQEATDIVNDTIDDMFGLISFVECEPSRSGATIFEKIDKVMELIQISNLIMTMIDFKSKNRRLDKKCKVASDFGEASAQDRATILEELSREEHTEFTSDDIASIIEDTFGVDAQIVTSDNNDIALVIKKDPTFKPRLNLYSCNLPELIKDYHLDSIIERAAAIDTDLIGEGQEPRTTNRERISVQDVDRTDNSIQVLPLDIPTGDGETITSIIADVIASKKRASTPVAGPLPGADITLAEANAKRRGLKESNSSVGNEDYSLGTIPGNTMPSAIFNKPVELQCGSISNIERQFSMLEEN